MRHSVAGASQEDLGTEDFIQQGPNDAAFMKTVPNIQDSNICLQNLG